MRPRLAVAALAAALAPGGTAVAAVAPVFTRDHARVGDIVGVVQPGLIRPVRPGRRPGVVVYLVTLRQALAFPGPEDGPPPRSLARLRLGELVTDASGTWRLRFRVPQVPPGAYTTLVWCTLCAGTTHPHGSVFAGGYLALDGVLHVVG